MSQISGMWPEAGAGHKRVASLIFIKCIDYKRRAGGDPGGPSSPPPPPPLQQLMGSRAGVKRDASWMDWKNHQELRMELPIPGRRLKPPCCVTWKSNRPLVPRLYSGGGSLPVTQMRAQLGPRIGYIYVCTWAFSRREKKGGKKKREREKRRQVEKMAFELEQVSTSVPLFFIPFLAWKI